MNIAPGTHVVPGLRLIRTIGEGAIGSVWLAEQEGRGQVAVKFLSASAAKHKLLAARFRREAEAASKMSNLHVVQVYDHGETPDGDAYVVMEYLEGESLADRLGRAGQVSIELTAELVPQLGSALQAAHDAGLVHRDIKPANIFLVGSSDHPMLKVLDFGVAKDLRVKNGSVVTGTGVAVGSPLTMSPEQVLGSRHVDYRSDLWSFAVVVYRLVCGRLPFLANNPNALAFAICRAQYTPPSELGAPAQLDPWFKRAFQPSKEKRFQSAREQAAAFADALTGANPSAVDVLDESTMDGESSLQADDEDANQLTLDDEDDAETLQRAWSEEERKRMQALVDQMEASMASSGENLLDSDALGDPHTSSDAPSQPAAPGAAPSAASAVPSAAAAPGTSAAPVWPRGARASQPSEPSLAAVSKPSQPASPAEMRAPAMPSSIPAAGARSARGTYVAAAAVVVALVALLLVVRSVGSDGDEQPSADVPSSTPVVATSAAAEAEAPDPEPVAESESASPESSAASSAAPEVGGNGKLSIICVPGCSDVRVEGQSWGPSPVFEREVPAGELDVVLYQGALLAKKLTMKVERDTLTTERVVLNTVAPAPAPATASGVATATPDGQTSAAVPPELPAPSPPPAAPPDEGALD